ncbi:hypothetical protein KM043_015557 [Ampulex compressa]|nr:hypothetical protein KM043_015557 [Ampulex compressa]
MPGGRRNAAGRNGPANRMQISLGTTTNVNVRSNSGERTAGSGADDRKFDEAYSGKALAPKHVPIPMVPVDGQLTFEALSFGVSIVAACLQMLNLYRTVWWLPHSYNNYSVNFYLIDPYLLIFILTMIARQFVYTLLRRFVDVTSPTRWLYTAQRLMRFTLLVIVIGILSWCLCHMAERHNSMKIFYLCYPSLSVYFVMFGVSVAPFFDISTAPLYSKEDKKTKFILDKPLHNCSLNASAIRAEVSTLRSDFNQRLKRVLFASSGSAYVCGIAPIIFVPQHLHFNISWVVQHVIMFWLGRISAHFSQAYPVRYCDVLHRAALHLGRWVKIENRNSHTYAQTWNESVLWPHGSIVRYNKAIYRSEGLCTVAEPGNPNHYRFHALFSNPTMLLCSLLGLQLLLIGLSCVSAKKVDELNESYDVKRHHCNASSKHIVAGIDNARSTVEGNCAFNPPPGHNLSSPLECARTCNDQEPPKTCYYHFIIEHYIAHGQACELCTPNVTNSFCNHCACVPMDGVERPILTVNRMIPGPAIEVCLGDKVIIDVENRMQGEEITIHWHGVYQKGYQYYDGVSFITQCPITSHSTFRYQWKAKNAGTHFWHAHTGLHKLDGIFGPLIIRESACHDVHSELYDYDLSHHTIVINDWMHELAASRLPGRIKHKPFQQPENILINGKGRYYNSHDQTTTNTSLSVFNVEPNKRYRFRLSNAFCTTCPASLTIEGHNLTVIATDGVPVKPVVANTLVSVSSERYDFIINTDKPVGSYWIQLRGLAPCNSTEIQQLAILSYAGAGDPTTVAPTYNTTLPQGIVFNPPDSVCDTGRKDEICIIDLNVMEIDETILKSKPDVQLYLPVSFHAYDIMELFQPNSFKEFMFAPGGYNVISMVDGISFLFPPSPLLTQREDIPEDMICNRHKKPANCGVNCMCTHVIDLPLNAVVELILYDGGGVSDLLHPFHLHGYAFHVIAMNRPANATFAKNMRGLDVHYLKDLDSKGLLHRNFDSPPAKDTMAIPNQGYTVVRFYTDNPGYWNFHCHFIYHQSIGMDLVLHVGDDDDLPPMPHNFPTCGDHKPPIHS